MSGARTATAWADSQSFLGKIHLWNNRKWAPVHVQETHYDLSFDVTVRHDSGWLQVGGDEAAEVFLFRYHSRGPDRLHFLISSATDSTRKLGTATSGQLGLYSDTQAANFWKLQPLRWGGDQLRCLFRDHLGHQVKTLYHDGPGNQYLTTGPGNLHEYLIVRAL